MRKVLVFAMVAVGLLMGPGAALAACQTNTIMVGGRMVICTTCCYGSHCSTQCF